MYIWWAAHVGKKGFRVSRGAHELSNSLDKSSGLQLIPKQGPEFVEEACFAQHGGQFPFTLLASKG